MATTGFASPGLLTEGKADLAWDSASLVTPYMVAGAIRLARALKGVDDAKGIEAGAESAANAARLRNQLTAQEIAGGHAFEKHVIKQGEFRGLGIRTREQFENHIDNVINNPTAKQQLSSGRTAYWDDATRTVVIRNPRAANGGIAVQLPNGRAYFDGLG